MKIFTLCILFSLCMMAAGCAVSIPNIPNFKNPNPPKTILNWEEEKIVTPQVLTSDQGKNFIANKTEHRFAAHYDNMQPKAGFFSRVSGFFQGLGFWMILILLIAFVIAPGATTMWLWNQKNRFQNALVETVTAIKKSKAVDQHPDLHNALLQEQSPSTKQVVSEIRANI